MSDKMDLGKLQQIRDNIPEVELEIPAAELCARYEQLYTGAVNDVMREMLLTNQALPPEIAPLRDAMTCAGIAFTIRSAHDPTMGGEMELRVQMLDELHDDCIVIWNANGDDGASHWGGVMTRASMARGCKGAVIDGGIRDTKDILEQGLPIWYRYRTSNGALSRCKMTAYQVPIFVGDVMIRPGDVIFADLDGVLVIPRKIAVAVLLRAEAIRDNETEIKEWVDAGLTAEEIHDRGGYF